MLEIEVGPERYIVKADGESNHHILRELDAHERWLAPWIALGRAPRLVAGDRAAKILPTEYLPGELVLGSPAQEDPDTFRQAGALLAMLHRQPGRTDASPRRGLTQRYSQGARQPADLSLSCGDGRSRRPSRPLSFRR